MAAVKWVLVIFGTLSLVLLVLGKVLAWLNPPRPGRAPWAVQRQLKRALLWSVLVPAAVAVVLVALTLFQAL